MHILLGILGVVGVALFWYWRMRNAATAAREVVEIADDMRAAVRRFGYRRKANQNPLDGIEDPRLAAAGILAAFANMDGALSREEIDAIDEACGKAFACSAEDARQIGAYGRWLVQQSAGNMDEVIRRLARNLIGQLTAEERGQLLATIREIAEIEDGALSDAQEDSFRRLEHQLV
ncbi:TerB family tellurite resistance protein [Pelagibius sp.]|uniref:tellurite resistance TerB family protein n=1 Tax=Pelagibius sp. TaxID=1931238 RepID=UPI00262359DF|nr:TerB family tellurite resistance protein [Pelagibius sp.]